MAKAGQKIDGNSLDSAQLSRLADRLKGTGLSAQMICAKMFGIATGGELADRLKAEHNLGRCPECRAWEHIPDGEVCQDCEDAVFDEIDEEG